MKKSIVASGGILAAVLASTCCVTPLLALAGALGIGVAQLSFLISIKTYLIIASLFAISYNLYKAYRPTNDSCCYAPDNKTIGGDKLMKSNVVMGNCDFYYNHFNTSLYGHSSSENKINSSREKDCKD